MSSSRTTPFPLAHSLMTLKMLSSCPAWTFWRALRRSEMCGNTWAILPSPMAVSSLSRALIQWCHLFRDTAWEWGTAPLPREFWFVFICCKQHWICFHWAKPICCWRIGSVLCLRLQLNRTATIIHKDTARLKIIHLCLCCVEEKMCNIELDCNTFRRKFHRTWGEYCVHSQVLIISCCLLVL